MSLSPRYSTIVADPPWQYTATPTTHRGGRRNTAETQYATMTNREIAALPIRELANENAHLYLWVTNPRLYAGRGTDDLSTHAIVEAWGFQYVTMLTWVKTGAPGLGWYFRGATEHVIFAVRGNAPILSDKRQSNVFTAPRAGHSEKPDLFIDLVEQVSPGPYLELFARRARFGWDYWGDESLQTASLAGDGGQR
jgi:N6-adenosine-specific RNA methylase IME4